MARRNGSTFAAGVLKAVYGINIAERGDRLLEVIDAAMEGVAEGLTPGAFLVEYFPFLRHVPAWVPGAGFQRKLKRWRDSSHEMVDMPFAQAKAAMVGHCSGPNDEFSDGLPAEERGTAELGREHYPR